MKKISLALLLILFTSLSLFAQTLQEINLTDAVTGKVINIQSQVKGNGLVLVFHSVACPFAKMYEARMIALRSKYQNQGFTFILVNPEVSGNDADKTVLRSYIDDSGMKMPYLIDENQVLSKHFKITKIPEVILITPGSEGTIISYRGALDNNPQAESAVSEKYLDRAMDSILKRESPLPSQVRAVGCNVRTF
ncbi:AhpC/TSA family protein [Algoriphagus ratkowskyi]|uniref:AhpC/TSA family protein n=1 Tax=Algoriphagus ratkowskyi TaxID=57028 RepID=A0A2W7R533_9BACT|nr:redoxin domain-containing protein [Algoriphagus ratkowskyi]PZX53410.1 AhpC/TSA family protein [Algoriphagus ratkowskyi]TXD76546.1 redoxin domain-containing protein [Algoriphagus ratkowskyi]